MAQSPEDQPPSQHVDEVAWMREVKQQREIDERLDWKEYYLQHPDYPGYANDNKRHGPDDLSEPVPNPEIDALLVQLVSDPKERVSPMTKEQNPPSSDHRQADQTPAEIDAEWKLEKLKRAQDVIAAVLGPRRSLDRQQAGDKPDQRADQQHKQDNGLDR